MATVLDHTIVPVKDREKSVEFYTRIFGFDNLGEVGPFLAVKVNDTLNFDFGNRMTSAASTTRSPWTTKSSKTPSPGSGNPGFRTATAPESRKT